MSIAFVSQFLREASSRRSESGQALRRSGTDRGRQTAPVVQVKQKREEPGRPHNGMRYSGTVVTGACEMELRQELNGRREKCHKSFLPISLKVHLCEDT